MTENIDATIGDHTKKLKAGDKVVSRGVLVGLAYAGYSERYRSETLLLGIQNDPSILRLTYHNQGKHWETAQNIRKYLYAALNQKRTLYGLTGDELVTTSPMVRLEGRIRSQKDEQPVISVSNISTSEWAVSLDRAKAVFVYKK